MLISGVFSMKDPDALKRAIEHAIVTKPSQNDIAEQRISFVMASVSDKSGITRDMVRKVIAG